jgi:hypothetical protein
MLLKILFRDKVRANIMKRVIQNWNCK